MKEEHEVTVNHTVREARLGTGDLLVARPAPGVAPPKPSAAPPAKGTQRPPPRCPDVAPPKAKVRAKAIGAHVAPKTLPGPKVLIPSLTPWLIPGRPARWWSVSQQCYSEVNI